MREQLTTFGNMLRGKIDAIVSQGESEMKRYLLFGGERYYAQGGWCDFRGDFETEEEAIARGDEGSSFSECYRIVADAAAAIGHGRVCFKPFEWWHVIDSATGAVVHEYDSAFGGGFEPYKGERIGVVPPPGIDPIFPSRSST